MAEASYSGSEEEVQTPEKEEEEEVQTPKAPSKVVKKQTKKQDLVEEKDDEELETPKQLKKKNKKKDKNKRVREVSDVEEEKEEEEENEEDREGSDNDVEEENEDEDGDAEEVDYEAQREKILASKAPESLKKEQLAKLAAKSKKGSRSRSTKQLTPAQQEEIEKVVHELAPQFRSLLKAMQTLRKTSLVKADLTQEEIDQYESDKNEVKASNLSDDLKKRMLKALRTEFKQKSVLFDADERAELFERYQSGDEYWNPYFQAQKQLETVKTNLRKELSEKRKALNSDISFVSGGKRVQVIMKKDDEELVEVAKKVLHHCSDKVLSPKKLKL